MDKKKYNEAVKLMADIAFKPNALMAYLIDRAKKECSTKKP